VTNPVSREGGIVVNDVMGDVVDELVGELTGHSSRKWAVMLLALVVGAALAFWLVRRRAEAASAVSAAVPAEVGSAGDAVPS
jgi:hypothetical protein